MEAREAHRILGIDIGAGSDEIRSAYLRRSSSVHPDDDGDLSEFGSVVKAYETLSRIRPGLDGSGEHLVHVWYDRGVYLRETGARQDALACFAKAVAANPHFIKAHNAKTDELCVAGRHDDALACCDEAISANPELPDLPANKAPILLELNRHEEAIQYCDMAIRIDPKYARAYAIKAAVLLELRQDNQAISCCEKALEIDPMEPTAHNIMGAALGDAGRYEDARSHCEKAIEIDPKYTDAYVTKAQALAGLGRDNEAISCCEKALEIDPMEPTAHNLMGAVLYDAGRYEDARSHCEKAVEIDPKYTDAYVTKSLVLSKMRMYGDAIECCDMAIGMDPTLRDAHLAKIVSLDRLKRHQEALDACERWLETTPKDRDILRIQARIRFNMSPGGDRGDPDATRFIIASVAWNRRGWTGEDTESTTTYRHTRNGGVGYESLNFAFEDSPGGNPYVHGFVVAMKRNLQKFRQPGLILLYSVDHAQKQGKIVGVYGEAVQIADASSDVGWEYLGMTESGEELEGNVRAKREYSVRFPVYLDAEHYRQPDWSRFMPMSNFRPIPGDMAVRIIEDAISACEAAEKDATRLSRVMDLALKYM